MEEGDWQGEVGGLPEQLSATGYGLALVCGGLSRKVGEQCAFGFYE